MKQWAFLVGIVATFLTGSLVNWSGAAAQEAGAFAPDPAACQTEPRSVEEIVALFTNATPAATGDSGSVEVPTGRVASEALASSVTSTVHEAFACLNGGNMLSFFGLLTDGAIVTTFPWIGEELRKDPVSAELTNPAPLPADQFQTIVAVADIRSLGPDRAGAVVVFLDPASGNPGANALYLVFTRDDGRWLIDQVIEFGNE
jgi:hypothetical protein